MRKLKLAELSLQERGAIIPKVPISLDMPLGEASFANNLCRPYWKKPLVAIVGNGPLTNGQREDIASAPVVVRLKSSTSVWIALMGIQESVKESQHNRVLIANSC